MRFLSALRRGNVHGALGAGLAPGVFPGRVSLDAGAEWFTEHWGATPAERGLDAAGILGAAADGKIQVLVLLGADPLSDFPDADLAQRGVDGAGFVIAVDGFVSDSTRRADVFLPCTLWGEKTGTITNLEDRVQRVGRKVAPEGTAMDDWRIAVELAYRLGRDFDLATVDEVADEVARVAPVQLGATAALLRRARDGVVLPFREHVDEIVLRTRELSILSEDGQGTSWDPIKVEGEAAADVAEAQDPPVVDPEPEVAATAPVPPLLEWDRGAPTVNVPPRDGYALRLVVGRTLYDHGRIVSETPAFGRLVPDNVLRVNPHDLAALGVDSGTEVKITAARASLTRPVVGDPAVPVGVAAMAFPADGTGPALIIDTAAPVTDVRVETLR